MTARLRHGVFLDLETVDQGDIDRTRLQDALPGWTWHEFTPQEELADRIREADVVVTNKCRLGAAEFKAAPRLRLVVLAATGTNNIELGAAASANVLVCNIRDYATEAVAQHTITLMLNLLTGLPWYRDAVRSGEWSRARQFCLQHRPIRQARGLVFGLVGAGVLGRRTAELAGALGMGVQVAEHRGSSPRPGRLAFEEVIAQADVVSLHCPLNEQTRGLVDRAVLQNMKTSALLLNTARGGIVVEQDLADALRAGEIAGAGIDTLSQEPPAPDHPLLAPDIPNLLVTPHNAWASRESRQAAVDQIAGLIAAFQAGKPRHVVTAQ